MPNLYTPYDGGTFEGIPIQPFNLNDGSNPGVHVYGTYSSDSEFAIEGTKSAKVTISSDAYASRFPGTGAKYAMGQYNSYFRSVPGTGFNNIISLSPGRYRMSMKVITPSGNPVAGDDALVGIGDIQAILSNNGLGVYNGTWTDLGGGKFKFRSKASEAALFGNAESIFYRVSALKDTIQTISHEWDDPTLGRDAMQPLLIILLNKPNITTVPIPVTQNLLIGGKLFFDAITLGPATPDCSIAFSSPAFDKTDETIALHDGTITIHATGQGALQYKLDSGAFQFSNVFTGLDPGSYIVTVKDASACSNITTNVIILEFDPPDPEPPPPAGPLTMDEKPLNPYNFISWFTVVGQLGFSGGVECINEFWDLPRGYRLNAFTKNHYAVIMQGEDFSFYINFENAITYPSFSNLKVALCTSGGVVKADCGPLVKDANPDNSYNIYATLNLDASIKEGKYFLLIYDSATNATLFMSSGIEMMTERDAKSQTVRCINRNTYDIYKYYYSRVPNYVNQIRLQMNLMDEEPEATIVNYRAVSNGRLRNVSIELDKWIQLETYFFDDNAIRGIYVFQICDTININGKDYIIKDIYKTTWNQKRCVNKGLVSFYEQEFSTANRFGVPGNLTIVGSDDPLLLGDSGGFIKL